MHDVVAALDPVARRRRRRSRTPPRDPCAGRPRGTGTCRGRTSWAARRRAGRCGTAQLVPDRQPLLLHRVHVERRIGGRLVGWRRMGLVVSVIAILGRSSGRSPLLGQQKDPSPEGRRGRRADVLSVPSARPGKEQGLPHGTSVPNSAPRRSHRPPGWRAGSLPSSCRSSAARAVPICAWTSQDQCMPSGLPAPAANDGATIGSRSTKPTSCAVRPPTRRLHRRGVVAVGRVRRSRVRARSQQHDGDARPPEARRLDDAREVVVGGPLRQLAQPPAAGADDVRAGAHVGAAHPTAHRAGADVGDALAQPGRHGCRQVVHLADPEDEGVGPRQQHAPDLGVLGHRPPRVARRPAQARDDVRGRPGRSGPGQRGRAHVRVEPGVVRTLGALRPVEAQRVREDEDVRQVNGPSQRPPRPRGRRLAPLQPGQRGVVEGRVGEVQSRSVVVTMSATAARIAHLRSAGMTYHGRVVRWPSR